MKWLSSLLMLAILISGCNGVEVEPTPEPKVRILACGTMRTLLPFWHEWPGGQMAFLREMNADLMKCGVTHILTDNFAELLIQGTEAKRTGMRLVAAGLPHLRYDIGETGSTGSSRARMWTTIEALKRLDVWRHVDAIWIADDQKKDNEQAAAFRKALKEALPGIELHTSSTTWDTVGYMASLRDPKPGQVMGQLYPWWWLLAKNDDGTINREWLNTFVARNLAAARPQDGIWFQCFGGSDWNYDASGESRHWRYAPPRGELLKHMQQAWDAGLRGYYGLFKVLWYKPPGRR